MVYACQINISTGNKVSLNDQSQEVSVTLTYQLEREDTDVLAIVQEKTAELAQAHRLVWEGLHKAKVSGPASSQAMSPQVMPLPSATDNKSEIDSSTVSTPERQETTGEETTGEEAIDEDALSENIPPNGLGKLSASLSHLPPDVWVEPVAPLQPATPGQRGALRVLLAQAGWNEQQITTHLRTQFNCEALEDLTGAQAAEWLLELQRTARQEAEQQRLHA